MSEEEAPLAAVVDETHVYWAAAAPQQDGTFLHQVRRASKTIGELVQTLATSAREIATVAVVEDDVVWLEGPADVDGQGGALRAVGKHGGESARTIIAFDASLGRVDVFSLQAKGMYAYFLSVQNGNEFLYTLWRVSLQGGDPEPLASHTLPVLTTVRSAQLDGANLFWAFQSGWIYRASTDAPGPAELLLDDVDGVDGWTFRGDQIVYLANGAVRAIPKGGSSTAGTAVAPVQDAYRALAATSYGLIWGTKNEHTQAETIALQRSDGFICTLVEDGVASAYTTTLDGKTLYWTNTATKAFGGAVRFVRWP